MSNNDHLDNQEARDIPLEVAPIEQITRAEVSQQIETALAHPRNMKKFMARAESMISIDQETAESCIYRLRRKDRESPGGYKVIEGESIRMAEIVAATYGNLRSAVQIVGHTPERVTVRAVCHDLETNNLVAIEKQARTTYSDGSPYNQDMALITTNALVSKALRDAIFRVVPKALIRPLRTIALQVAFGDGETFRQRRTRAIEWATKTRKVPLERVLGALGVPAVENMTVEHLELLTGLKNAIMNEEQSIEDAFPPIEGESKPQMTHPEKTKQQAQGATPTPSGVTQHAETKPAEPKKEPAPKAAAKNVVKMPEPKTEPKPEPAPEPPPQPEEQKIADVPAEPPSEPAEEGGKPTPPEPTPLSEKQQRLKDEMEGRGHTLQDFVEWGSATLFKSGPKPIGWADIPEEKAAFFVNSIKGISETLKKWKAARSK